MDKNQKTKIGKDVIESITLGMYEDARIIFREYVQNSADQIDMAVKEEVLQSRDDGEIWINIDKKKRQIIIEDNATGIKENEVVDILKNIAQSKKQRGVNKGFRGLGRLAGLAYCDMLTFETSFKGEKIKTIMIWSAKDLKQIINDRNKKEEASDVIDTITAFDSSEEAPEKHYFKVILEDVCNETLLDKKEIKKYLEMVAPIPYPREFMFIKEIKKYVKDNNVSLDEYKVYVNTEILFKSYTTSIYDAHPGGKQRIDEIFELKFFNSDSSKESPLYWGWYGISTFKKQIPAKCNPARGIRLRKGNIQIGSENCIVKFHKEPRGNFYFFGEIHAEHMELIPNARRDYFIENEAVLLFEDDLKRFFQNDLYNLYYFASNVRGHRKKIENLVKAKREYEEKHSKGFTDKEEKKKYEEEFEKIKEQAEKAEKKLSKYENEIRDSEDTKKKVFEKIVAPEISKVNDIDIPEDIKKEKPFISQKLSKLTKKEQKFLSRAYSIINKVLPKETADNLILKINEEFE